MFVHPTYDPKRSEWFFLHEGEFITAPTLRELRKRLPRITIVDYYPNGYHGHVSGRELQQVSGFDEIKLQEKHSSDWSDEEMGKLRALAESGLSAAEIAFRMNRTRNAIIGKCHRKKIKLLKSNRDGGRRIRI